MKTSSRWSTSDGPHKDRSTRANTHTHTRLTSCIPVTDAKTSAPAWPNLGSACVSGRDYVTEPQAASARPQDDAHSEGPLSPVMRGALEAVCSTLLEKREELDALDRAAGDGDCGNTHAAAAKAIQEWLRDHAVPGDPGQLLSVLAGLVQEKMGGSSGALDALCPAVDELLKLTTAPPGGQMAVLQAAVRKASSGAEATRDLAARAGRASYIAAERVTLPDPGAVAVAAILRAVLESLEKQK
ncbi:Triokinase/FMN cyclase [Liparis tanakae]|uniref:Triokinase/FMN cyclase n=1 Tax=Liparis tanakae TaxID=230148 RepID=A0A4Z2EFG7_9TELE|nr:Triokinase/FMN cyclase [Liparis tanakae]